MNSTTTFSLANISKTHSVIEGDFGVPTPLAAPLEIKSSIYPDRTADSTDHGRPNWDMFVN